MYMEDNPTARLRVLASEISSNNRSTNSSNGSKG